VDKIGELLVDQSLYSITKADNPNILSRNLSELFAYFSCVYRMMSRSISMLVCVFSHNFCNESLSHSFIPFPITMSRSVSQSTLQFKSTKQNKDSQLINNKNPAPNKFVNNNKDEVIDTEITVQPNKPALSSAVIKQAELPLKSSPNKRSTRSTRSTSSTEEPVAITQPKRPSKAQIDLEIAETRAELGILDGTWVDASSDELLLRKFDLDVQFGPCSGLSRRERWLRAKELGLTPPQNILDILDRHPETRESEEFSPEPNSSPNKKMRNQKETEEILDKVAANSIFTNPAARVLEFENRD
jgi:DNA polymerase delta subunit 4